MKPGFEYFMYSISAIFLVIFVVSYLRNPERTAFFKEIGILLVFVPAIPALVHRRIRIEREKGRDALIEKYREVAGRRR